MFEFENLLLREIENGILLGRKSPLPYPRVAAENRSQAVDEDSAFIYTTCHEEHWNLKEFRLEVQEAVVSNDSNPPAHF